MVGRESLRVGILKTADPHLSLMNVVSTSSIQSTFDIGIEIFLSFFFFFYNLKS